MTMFWGTEDGIDSEFYHDLNSSAFTSPWLDMRDFDRIMAHIQIGATYTDSTLTTVKFQQSQSSSGTNPIDLTTSGTGLDYDPATFTPTVSVGNIYIETRQDQQEMTVPGYPPGNGYRYVALYVAQTGPGGSDIVYGHIRRFECTKRQRALPGAGYPFPTTTNPATLVYVQQGAGSYVV